MHHVPKMDSEPREVEKQASAIAHEFFWCVAGRHQACVEQLQNTSGAMPDPVWWSLCFEPLVFGLSFFAKCVRKQYAEPEQELFVAELETAIRWLLATTLFSPCDVDSPESQTQPSARTEESSQGRWVLSRGHERALAPFSGWCKARQGQFQEQTNPQTDSDSLFEGLKADTARDGFCCPDTVLRVFAEGVLCDADRIRSEVFNDSRSAKQRPETMLPHARTG